jgi:PIN domain nuclease of toxin-antitoxin system
VGRRGTLNLTILLDTHTLVWWQAGGRRLSRRAGSTIRGAEALLISPLTGWEVATLHRLGRLVLDRDPSTWIRDLMRSDRLGLAPLTIEASAWAGMLPATFPGDPIDRLLYATARDLRVPLVTKNDRLRSFARAAGDVEVIW